jgi:NitT/TauT family transport system substrate-binding protein
MDLHSNAIIVSRKFVKEHPEAVRGFLKALNHGIKDAMADPQAAIDAVVAREPLIKPVIERARLDATLAEEMSHPEIAKIGLGDGSDELMTKSIDILVKAKGPTAHADGRGGVRSWLFARGQRTSDISPRGDVTTNRPLRASLFASNHERLKS